MWSKIASASSWLKTLSLLPLIGSPDRVNVLSLFLRDGRPMITIDQMHIVVKRLRHVLVRPPSPGTAM
jgi:hypothetical protein